AKSPYQVTGDVTLFPNDTLTIEPGVVVKFDKGTKLDVRGTLISIGTVKDSIIFTSSINTKSSWNGLSLRDKVSGIFLKYCIVQYADTGIIILSDKAKVNIKNIHLRYNHFGMQTFAHISDYKIDNCLFSENIYGGSFGYCSVTNSSFVNNVVGCYFDEGGIFNSRFCKNSTGVWTPGSNVIIKNCIVMNNQLGMMVVLDWHTSHISNNVISQNDTGITMYMSSGVSYGIDSNNKICGNRYYDVVNNSPTNISFNSNCWGDTSKANISKKIYDGYDNSKLGLIDFSNYLNCDTSAIPKTNCQNTVITTIKEVNQDKISITLSPNPMHEYAILRTNAALRNAEIGIYNLVGQKLIELRNQSGNEFSLNKGQLPNGLYFIKITAQGNSIGVVKMVVRYPPRPGWWHNNRNKKLIKICFWCATNHGSVNMITYNEALISDEEIGIILNEIMNDMEIEQSEIKFTPYKKELWLKIADAINKLEKGEELQLYPQSKFN
ncbi:MAG: T9SS type A sorting domain-containing protein, partial [Bacteroidetes bacterium]|nr:T9SS type A sorting domain-containing protein [Bacteroidota bacterium]